MVILIRSSDINLFADTQNSSVYTQFYASHLGQRPLAQEWPSRVPCVEQTRRKGLHKDPSYYGVILSCQIRGTYPRLQLWEGDNP